MTLDTDPLFYGFNDFLNGRSDAEFIVRSDDFDDDIIPVSWFFRNFEKMPTLEQEAMRCCSGTVLDLGAGAGAHSIYLQKKGFDTVSLDSSPGAVECMRSRGLKNVVHNTLNNYHPQQKFETVLMLMNGIGMAGSIDVLPAMLSKLKLLIKQTGQILFDSSDLIYLYESDDSYAINLNDKYYGESCYEILYGEHSSGKFDWLYIDFPLIREIAEQHGLHCELIAEGPHFDYLARLSLP